MNIPEVLHVSRMFGKADDYECACPRAACGYVIFEQKSAHSQCDQHNGLKTLRSVHDADYCPAMNEGEEVSPEAIFIETHLYSCPSEMVKVVSDGVLMLPDGTTIKQDTTAFKASRNIVSQFSVNLQKCAKTTFVDRQNNYYRASDFIKAKQLVRFYKHGKIAGYYDTDNKTFKFSAHLPAENIRIIMDYIESLDSY